MLECNILEVLNFLFGTWCKNKKEKFLHSDFFPLDFFNQCNMTIIHALDKSLKMITLFPVRKGWKKTHVFYRLPYKVAIYVWLASTKNICKPRKTGRCVFRLQCQVKPQVGAVLQESEDYGFHLISLTSFNHKKSFILFSLEYFFLKK